MPTDVATAFDVIRDRHDIFRDVLELVLGKSANDLAEKWKASRKIAAIVLDVAGEIENPERPPLVADVFRMASETKRAAQALLYRSDNFKILFIWNMLFPPHPDSVSDELLDDDFRVARIHPMADKDIEVPPELVESLTALVRICDVICERIPPGLSPRADAPMQCIFNPRLRLVISAAMLFAEYRRRDLIGSFERPFYEFCAALIELVTGTHPEQGDTDGGLRRYVEFVAPRVRQLAPLIDRRNLLWREDPRDHQVAREIVQLEAGITRRTQELNAGPFRRRTTV